MKHLEKLTRKRLGDILADEGLLTKEQLAGAEREHGKTGDPLGAILVEANHITDWDLAKIVATQYQLPFVEIHSIGISPEVEDLFSLEEQVKYRFVPLDRMGEVLTLAVVDMPDMDFLRSIQERTGLTPFLYVALLSDIRKRLTESGALFEDVLDAVAQGGVTPPEAKKAPVAEAAEPVDGEPLAEEDVGSIIGEALSGGEWENLFDSANESVLKEIDRE
jgi:hypothetical protein